MPSALICDVRGSRRLDNWPEVFATLRATLDEANRRFADALVIPFHTTVGDEFQGALDSPARTFAAYTFLKASLPVGIYAGLGLGGIEQPGPGITGLRGSAFYRGRVALEACKEERGLIRVDSGRTPDLPDKLADSLVRLWESIELKWTSRQREVISRFRLHPDWKQSKLAEQFSISEPTLSRILRSARWDLVKDAENTLTQYLTDLHEKISL
ncbi:MAG: hypothetical protein C4524_08230 [Candidatus Zixiibacteriota bacterium]|nr:MAG: hypothetical protein C4524_08230 [candidate division Zixibacteria bacterium]